MLLNVLFVLAIIAFTALNIILIKEAIERELTFSEIIAENEDTHLGKILMISLSIPAFIVLYIKSLLPINTKSCFDEDNTSVYKYYSLNDILQLPEKDKVIITPDNYHKILQYIIVANKNKDVDIDIRTEGVNEKYLDCCAFYGVKIGVLNKRTLSNGIEHYLITCYNASRDEIKA